MYENLPQEYRWAVTAVSRCVPTLEEQVTALLTLSDTDLVEFRGRVEDELARKPDDETSADFRYGRTAALQWLLDATAALYNGDLSADDFT